MKEISLTTGLVSKHVRDLAMPASIGLFFQTMYNVVDSFYGGQISTDALAALGLSFPVFLMIVATSGGLSRGSSALIANAIGSKEDAKYRRLVDQGLSMSVVVAILVTILGLISAKPLFLLMGANDELLSIALAYMRPIIIGSIFLIVSSLCNAILIAHGDSKTFSKVLIAGFVLNLILDPWFLYGGFGLPPMGIAGIAWATVAIQMCGCVYMLGVVLRRGLVRLTPLTQFIPNLKTYGEIAYQAFPASFSIMSVALGFFVTTYFLTTYGQSTVAAYTVTTRIEQIALLPTFGLSAAIMALVGQNNGAGKIDRVAETMNVCTKWGLIIVLTSSVLMFVFADAAMRIFSDDPEVVQIGVTCLRIIAFVQWAYVMTSTHLAMLQAMKRPMYGFFESVTRKIILPMPLLWLFVAVWNKPVEWIWYTSAATTVLMTAVTMVYARSLIRQDSDTKPSS